jgi:hypothetical protein
VPDVQNTSFCVDQFPAQNATSTGNGANNTRCTGALSDTCTDCLVDTMKNFSSSTVSSDDAFGELPDIDADQKRRTEACGKDKDVGWIGELYPV